MIQYRTDDSEDFDRSWDDYVKGFGIFGNYWVGLENIHQLTTRQATSLEIVIWTFDGDVIILTYSSCSVGDATSNYVATFSGHSTSSNLLTANPFVNGSMFTTKDRDNDQKESWNCASDIFSGGWWYSRCGCLNLNGNYEGDVDEPTRTGIIMCYIGTTSGNIEDLKTISKSKMSLIHPQV